jgi:L-threonylcarbamoyladenylate synthase
MEVTITEALKILQNNDLVSIPTETVWGLAARISSPIALEKIFSLKQRPFFDPLIVHFSSLDQIAHWQLHLSKWEKILAKHFWPGPLTLILKKNDSINSLITSGLETVGVRIPHHPETLKLIEHSGPLAAPSANLFTQTSPTKVEDVLEAFGKDFPTLNEGDFSHYSAQVGIESTIVSVKEGHDKIEIELHRPGMITREDMENILKHHTDKSIVIRTPQEDHNNPQAPGQIKHHYCPKTPLYVYLQSSGHQVNKEFSWPMPTDSTLVARQLYQKMRELDKKASSHQHNSINFILPFESFQDAPTHQWEGILNRLKKASVKFP